jgi:succinate dehydrogenase/fumarate reductase flavoprotein subunit
MFKCLSKEVKEKGIPVFDFCEVIALLTAERGSEKHVIGALALDMKNLNSGNFGFVIFNAVNVVLGTGGPAGIYKTSVYPESQMGSSGLALEIGAVGHNLTESQFGLASTKFRWNLSGTYQQVIPRYVSTDQSGKGEKDFLNQYFPDMGKLATAIFLKGYQWPFDPGKVKNYGSSLIDILVYQETVQKRRRVFLDFLQNPTGSGILEDFDFKLLSSEAYDYLQRSGALLGTPIERLQKMNQPAIDLYRRHNIDIAREKLEIAVCAQHNNGGIKGNIWWESGIKHLFPVGEVNGTHGVYRPGGSALNSGQVGSLRAALYISKRYSSSPPDNKWFEDSVRDQIQQKIEFAGSRISGAGDKRNSIRSLRAELQERMSSFGAHIRDPEEISVSVKKAWDLHDRMKNEEKIPSPEFLPALFKNLDLCLTHALYLEAIKEYLEKGGKSRGSYLVLDAEGEKPCKELREEWRFRLNEPDSFVNDNILELRYEENCGVKKQWVNIRPIPDEDTWFENVWNEFRNNNIVK